MNKQNKTHEYKEQSDGCQWGKGLLGRQKGGKGMYRFPVLKWIGICCEHGDYGQCYYSTC